MQMDVATVAMIARTPDNRPGRREGRPGSPSQHKGFPVKPEVERTGGGSPSADAGRLHRACESGRRRHTRDRAGLGLVEIRELGGIDLVQPIAMRHLARLDQDRQVGDVAVDPASKLVGLWRIAGSPALLMTRGRRRSIPSPSQPVSNHVPGASCCFRSSCWALPKGAASSVPVSMSRTSPSIWRPPPPRRPAPSAATTHRRVHSRYTRRLDDLPCLGRCVRLQVAVRRFVCPRPDCPRRIFAERLPGFAAPWARTTDRLRQTQTDIGSSLGGEAGCPPRRTHGDDHQPRYTAAAGQAAQERAGRAPSGRGDR